MTRLRPLVLEDVSRVTAWMTDPGAGGEYQWAGFASPEALRRAVADGSVLGPDGGSLAIVDDLDELVGDVSWRRVRTGPAYDSWCWSIGIVVLSTARGRGHGRRAQAQLADYLFAHTTCERVEADTDVENVAEQRALEAAGFTREGVLRRRQWRDGAWRDVVLYSRLRGD